MKDSVKLDRFVDKLDKLCKQYGVRIHARTDPKDGMPIAVEKLQQTVHLTMPEMLNTTFWTVNMVIR